MYRKIMEWQGAILLSIIIVLGAQYAWERITHTTGVMASRVENGVIKDLEQLVVSEQTNKFAEFVNFNNPSTGVKVINWLGFTEFGKATIFFKWQARTLYGIKITDKTPLTWKRMTGQPGVIEISSPELTVLETKIGLGKDELVFVKVNKSVLVNEAEEEVGYLPEVQKRSDIEASNGLSNENLRANAVRIIAHHIISLINQGARYEDKVNTAQVNFRKG